MEIAEEPEEKPVNLFLIQLRSSYMKALDVLLEDRENARIFLKEGGLSAIMHLSTRPTQLDEFKTVEQLQSIEDRLTQLFYEVISRVIFWLFYKIVFFESIKVILHHRDQRKCKITMKTYTTNFTQKL
jgi:hypothetical protein